MMIAVCALAGPRLADDHVFHGPRAGVEVAHEDCGDGVSGEAVAAVAGWDFRLGQRLVLGVDARYALHGDKGSETTATPGQLLQTVDVAIRNDCGIGGRLGHAVSGRVMAFVHGGCGRNTAMGTAPSTTAAA
jgi:hypothetical protein